MDLMNGRMPEAQYRRTCVEKFRARPCSGTTTSVNEMKVIRLKAVMNQTGLARSTIYKLMKEKRFPQSIALGARSVGWLESEVFEWIGGQVLASRS